MAHAILDPVHLELSRGRQGVRGEGSSSARAPHPSIACCPLVLDSTCPWLTRAVRALEGKFQHILSCPALVVSGTAAVCLTRPAEHLWSQLPG